MLMSAGARATGRVRVGRRRGTMAGGGRPRPELGRPVRVRRAHDRRSTAVPPARAPARTGATWRSSRAPEAAEQAGFRSCRRCRPRETGPATRGRRWCARPAACSPRTAARPWRLGALAERGGRQPAPSAAHVQGRARRHPAAVRGRPPPGRLQGTAEEGRFRDRSALRRRLRIEQPPLRGRAGAAGDDAGDVSPRRARACRSATPWPRSPLGSLLVAATARGVAAVSLGDSRGRAGSRPARRIPAGGDPRATTRARSAGWRWCSAHIAGTAPARGPAPRRAGDRLPAPRVAGAARDPARPDPVVLRGGAADREPHRRARRRAGLREQPRGPHRPLPPRGRGRRRPRRLSVGRRHASAPSSTRRRRAAARPREAARRPSPALTPRLTPSRGAGRTIPAVITGFNTDVKYRGVVYHVQTEDKGTANPMIETLIYKGGEILGSRRLPYARPGQARRRARHHPA